MVGQIGQKNGPNKFDILLVYDALQKKLSSFRALAMFWFCSFDFNPQGQKYYFVKWLANHILLSFWGENCSLRFFSPRQYSYRKHTGNYCQSRKKYALHNLKNSLVAPLLTGAILIVSPN